MGASWWFISEGMRPDVEGIEADGVAYCGSEVWTAELLPLLPDQWEPATFTPDQPMRWYFGNPRDEPVAEWLIEPGSSDAVHPDTSQPYFLDLIFRIDEMTQDQ